jgi:hypothetical protein
VSINCGGCSGERAVQCAGNFDEVRAAIEEGAEATANNGWMNYSFDTNGDVVLEPAVGYSEEAMFGNRLVRSMMVHVLRAEQDDLGCSLTRELIDQKLVAEL